MSEDALANLRENHPVTEFTYIILVNWNGWQDTLECLESVFRLQGNYRVVVCDNASSDDSLAKIQTWAKGQLQADTSDQRYPALTQPALAKPVPHQLLTIDDMDQAATRDLPPLTLIDCQENLGFAGGNNVGIRYALRQPDMHSVWLLNNDTVVDPAALSSLRAKADGNPQLGIVGSTLIYYGRPEQVQAFGGARYFRCIGLSMHVGRFRGQRRRVDEDAIAKRLDYVVGASMFVSNAFLQETGLMGEDYFLYYEELDWALRARGSYQLGYAQDSLVYHKAGASIGSSSAASSRSLTSDKYLMGNRLKITRRFFPRCLPLVRFFLYLEALQRLLKGKSEHARMIMEMLRGR